MAVETWTWNNDKKDLLQKFKWTKSEPALSLSTKTYVILGINLCENYLRWILLTFPLCRAYIQNFLSSRKILCTTKRHEKPKWPGAECPLLWVNPLYPPAESRLSLKSVIVIDNLLFSSITHLAAKVTQIKQPSFFCSLHSLTLLSKTAT